MQIIKSRVGNTCLALLIFTAGVGTLGGLCYSAPSIISNMQHANTLATTGGVCQLIMMSSGGIAMTAMGLKSLYFQYKNQTDATVTQEQIQELRKEIQDLKNATVSRNKISRERVEKIFDNTIKKYS